MSNSYNEVEELYMYTVMLNDLWQHGAETDTFQLICMLFNILFFVHFQN